MQIIHVFIPVLLEEIRRNILVLYVLHEYGKVQKMFPEEKIQCPHSFLVSFYFIFFVCLCVDVFVIYF